MEIRDWENIYKKRGIVQSGLLYTVEYSAEMMNKYDCIMVLDLACGTGRNTLYLASKGFTVFGMDISETAIEITKKRVEENGLSNVYLKKGDMFNIDYPDNFFDAVLCVWSTGHGYKQDIRNNIDEMRRVLKDGGRLFADFMSVEDDNYMRGTQLEENTFLHDHIDHPDVPHHYSTIDELTEFFSSYSEAKIRPIDYGEPNGDYYFKSFWVEAIK